MCDFFEQLNMSITAKNRRLKHKNNKNAFSLKKSFFLLKIVIDV